MSASESWGALAYGDPCRECAFEWDISADAALAYVDALPGEAARRTEGVSGAARSAGWSVSAYVAHVSDNLRNWAERLQAARLAGHRAVPSIDQDRLAGARRYDLQPLEVALWSLTEACRSWVSVVRASLDDGVVLLHETRGPLAAADVARNNAHDAHHHLWDIDMIRLGEPARHPPARDTPDVPPIVLDSVATSLLVHDVVLLDEHDLRAPTPCTGWTVGDLVGHMSTEHERIMAAVVGAEVPPRRPQDRFAASARRWTVGLGLADHTVEVPGLGPQPVSQVARVHFVDMLVHRWDLSRGLGRQVPTPDFLLDAAMPIARSITAPGSPLVGEGRAYRESTIDSRRPDGPAPIEILAGLLGRDPAWDRLR